MEGRSERQGRPWVWRKRRKATRGISYRNRAGN